MPADVSDCFAAIQAARLAIPKEIQTSIIGRLIALMAIVFLFASALLLVHARDERHDTIVRAEATALALTRAFEREVWARTYFLKGLASSPAYRSGDMRAFHEQLTSTPLPDGMRVTVWDLERQLINTARFFGSQLPKHRRL